jgi:hypothetical protein
MLNNDKLLNFDCSYDNLKFLDDFKNLNEKLE